MRALLMLSGLVMCMAIPMASLALNTASFAEFDQRAKRGERLTVVFFGASLTWGANASDPNTTSYRAVVQEYMEALYPKAHIKFFDAAIGGTGSQLGVFRLDRDVLRRKPDLVFLDFSANDDIFSDNPESLASYESLVRRIMLEAHAPVVPVIFPFGWNTREANLNDMKRRTATLALAKAYNTVAGDAILLSIQRVKAGKITVEQMWPSDLVHPCDAGYRLFGDAAWAAYREAVAAKLKCAVPAKMTYADTYMTPARVRISTLGPLPAGWRVATPCLTAAWHDGLMSRWLDDVVVADNRIPKAPKAEANTVVKVEPLTVNFTGSMVMLFGEETTKSGRYQCVLDGKKVTYVPYGWKDAIDYYDASAKRFGGNRQHASVIATGLDPAVTHTLQIVPIFPDAEPTELRLESICVAGPGAKVWK
jgi:lysophospholipase L1-like esterase